jgi:signal transduction histidine kinase
VIVLSAENRKGYLLGWFFLGTTTVAVLAAAVATTALHHQAEQATEHELQLCGLQATTNRLDALEWKAIAQRKITPELKEALVMQRQQSDTILTQLEATAISQAAAQKIVSAYETYVAAVNQLLKLLQAGEIQKAVELDKAAVDPSYDRLYEAIAEASTAATDTGKVTEVYAAWGSLATNLSLIVVISIIFSQYQRGNQRMQKALLEQASIRRSEQILRQDRELLEIKVMERTQEIEKKNAALIEVLADLKKSQIQLVQSEKMSSLGQLVAGVAHEINNPVGFIYGNVAHSVEYVQDLLQLIVLYQAEYPHPTAAVLAKLKEIDFDFLKQDIHRLFESMEMGAKRIQSIVSSLRNFSRLDEAEFKVADLHEGIDNTLVILASRLRAPSECPMIEVSKHYGDLPQIECYPGQLNQVFMNILSNAIDALESDPKHQQNDSTLTPTIAIRTEVIESGWVRVAISDNASGIPHSLQSKLFEPFFTTKPVGKGTGLGMSISYQIVDKHQGRLFCNSVPEQGTEFTVEIPICQISAVDMT